MCVTGEPFGCLQDLSTHKYVDLLFESLKSLRMTYILAYFPWLKYVGSLVVDKSLIQKRKEYLVCIFVIRHLRISRLT